MEIKIEELNNEVLSLIKENNKTTLKKKLKYLIKNRKILKHQISFWPNGLLIYSLLNTNSNINNKVIKHQYQLWKKKRFKVNYFDDALMCYCFEKSGLFTIKELNIIETKLFNILDDYKNQIIPYRIKNENLIFADLLGMVPPFLCLYGKKNNKSEIIDWAVLQFTSFFEKSNDQTTSLLYHAYNKNTNEKLGIIGWGRAIGWIMFGLSECLKCLDKGEKNYKVLEKYYLKLLTTVKKYQRIDGGFSWQLTALEGPLDTSATSLILLSLIQYKKNIDKNEDLNEIIDSAILCLKKKYKRRKGIELFCRM